MQAYLRQIMSPTPTFTNVNPPSANNFLIQVNSYVNYARSLCAMDIVKAARETKRPLDYRCQLRRCWFPFQPVSSFFRLRQTQFTEIIIICF